MCCGPNAVCGELRGNPSNVGHVCCPADFPVACGDETGGICYPAGSTCCTGNFTSFACPAGSVCLISESPIALECCEAGSVCGSSCCATGEVCTTSSVPGVPVGCCAPGRRLCTDGCCEGTCDGAGACCLGPVTAQGQCCNSLATLCNGQCCDGACTATGSCCTDQVCGSACCALPQVCLDANTSTCGAPTLPTLALISPVSNLVLGVTGDPPVRVFGGASVIVKGLGFLPGQVVLWLDTVGGSQVATATADASGTFSVQPLLNGTDGTHTLLAVGQSVSGFISIDIQNIH